MEDKTGSEDKNIEKGLLTFYNFLKKAGENEDFLAVIKDLKEVWDLINNFFEKHREKSAELRHAISLWHGKSNRDVADSLRYVKKIPSINDMLKEIIAKVLDKIKEDNKAYRKLYLPLVSNQDIERRRQLNNSLKSYFKHIKENFRHLKKLYRQQNRHLLSRSPGQIEEELSEYSFLYRLFTDEAELDKRLKLNIRDLITTIQTHLSNIEKEKYEKKMRIISRLNIHEIMNPSDYQMKHFYKDIMQVYFPEPDELDPVETYKKAAQMRYKKRDFGYYNFHLFLLKYGTEIVGSLLMDFLGDEKQENCIAILWFIAVKEQFRNEGFPMLIEAARKAAIHDKDVGIYKELVGAFFEIENYKLVPKDVKVSSKKCIPLYKRSLLKDYFKDEEIQYMLNLKPNEIPKNMLDRIPTKLIDLFLIMRERRYRQLGCKKIDIKYIQPQLDEEGEPVHYLNWYFYPMKKEWAKEIPSEKFLHVYDLFYEGYSAYLDKEEDPTYKTMVERIKKKKSIKLI